MDKPFPLYIKLLILLGLRSPCCGAHLYDVPGWNKTYCEYCDKVVTNNEF